MKIEKIIQNIKKQTRPTLIAIGFAVVLVFFLEERTGELSLDEVSVVCIISLAIAYLIEWIIRTVKRKKE